MKLFRKKIKSPDSQREFKKRRTLSIKSILPISLIFLILIVSSLILLFFMRLHRDIIEHYMRSKAIFVARMLSTMITPQHLLHHEHENLIACLKNISSDKDILYVALLNPKGELVVESGIDQTELPQIISTGRIPPRESIFIPLTDKKGDHSGYDVYMRVMSKNKLIGLSRLVLSFKDIKENLSHIRNALIILIGIITLLECILCLVLVNFFNKSMQYIIDAAERIADGEFNTYIPSEGLSAEASLLARHLNKIINNFRQYKDQKINQDNELNAIIDSMGSGLFTVDKDWKIQTFNKSAERITGYKAEAVIGKTCQEVFQSDACQDKCPLEKSLKEGGSVVNNDLHIKTIDGRKIPISASTSPLKNEAGEIIGGVEVFKDLTEIKELQKQLFQADKMSALGQMISGIAHEISNPTGVLNSNMISLSEYIGIVKTVLIKYRDLLQKFYNKENQKIEPDFSEVLEYEKAHDIDYILEDLDCLVEENKEASERIDTIVKGLKNFIHIDIGRLQLADINQRLDVSLDLVKFDKNIKIIKEYSDIPFVSCNVQQIDQVFINIILNAVQALGNKGEIRLKTSYIAEEDKVRIAIRDNGPGMTEDMLIKIFDPYFTTKEIGAGTGLGLSISFKIITQHGGKIWAESMVGKWTEFFIELAIKHPLSLSYIWKDD